MRYASDPSPQHIRLSRGRGSIIRDAFDTALQPDGWRISFRVVGPEGAPSVLFDHGAFGLGIDGWWLQEALATTHRVLIYDRAGMGTSDPLPDGQAPTPEWHVKTLRALAQQVGLKAPYILIGHSMAGLRLDAWNAVWPSELRCLVAIDAMASGPTARRAERFKLESLTYALQVGEWAAKWGIANWTRYILRDDIELPAQLRLRKRRAFESPTHWRSSRLEFQALEAKALRNYSNLAYSCPLIVFERPDRLYGFARAIGDRARSSIVSVIEPGETHTSYLSPKGSERIARAIRQL